MPYTKLRVHFVTATKNRRPLLTSEVETYLHEILPEIIRRCGGHLFVANGDVDHSHWLCALKPTVAPSKFMQVVKSDATTLIRRKFPRIKFEWQVSFSAFSVSPWEMDDLLNYIHRQKEHHAADTSIEKWESEDE